MSRGLGDVYKRQLRDLQVEQGRKTDLVICLLYTSPSPRDMRRSRMPSSA
ncbi:hypothetical protein JMUB7532_27590 [Staphylococcus aureus]